MEGDVVSRDEWRSTVRSTLRGFERSYPPESEDRTMGYFATAARMAIEHEDFYDLVYEIHESQPRVKPKEVVNILHRGYQADQLELRRQNLSSYPEGFDDTEKWLSTFAEVEDDMIRLGILSNNVCRNRIQSNIAERYKTPQLLASLMRDRLGDNPSVLDIGCSELHGGIKLVYSNQPDSMCKPFEPIQLSYNHHNRLFMPSKRLSRLSNLAIAQEIDYGEVVGVDITRIDDWHVKQWAKSCSFRTDELRDPAKEAEYDLLDTLDPQHQRVRFYNGDFSVETDVREFINQSPIDKYKIIIFSAILYQSEPDEQQAMLKHAYELLDEDGIILIQDDREGNFEQKYTFVASVIDAHDIDAGEQEIIRWESGRCKKGIVEDGLICLDGVKKNLSTMLQRVV